MAVDIDRDMEMCNRMSKENVSQVFATMASGSWRAALLELAEARVEIRRLRKVLDEGREIIEEGIGVARTLRDENEQLRELQDRFITMAESILDNEGRDFLSEFRRLKDAGQEIRITEGTR